MNCICSAESDKFCLPQRPPHKCTLFPDRTIRKGWADIDPLLSYKSNFDGTILGSEKSGTYIYGQELEQDISMTGLTNLHKDFKGNNRLAVMKQVDAYAMVKDVSQQEAEATGDYVTWVSRHGRMQSVL